MSVTLDAALGTGKAHSNDHVTVTITSAVAAGSVVVFCFAGFLATTADTFSVAGGSLTFTSAAGPYTSGSMKLQVFTAVAVSGLASSTVLTGTVSGGHPNDIMGSAIAFAGVNTTTPTDANNGSGATNTAWSSGNVLAASGDALVGFCFEDGSATATSSPTSPGVEFADFNDATQTEAFTGVYKLSVAGTDAIAGTWSTSVSHVRGACNLKPAAGGGGTTVKQLAALGVG